MVEIKGNPSSTFRRALVTAKWPAACGFLIGVSGALGIKTATATLIGKSILGLVVGLTIAIVFGLITFGITYLTFAARTTSFTGLYGAFAGYRTWFATQSAPFALREKTLRSEWGKLPRIKVPTIPLPTAIVIATGILALTIALIGRYDLQHGVVRMDRWTGTVSVCEPVDNTPVRNCDPPPKSEPLDDDWVSSNGETFKKPLDTRGLTPLPPAGVPTSNPFDQFDTKPDY